MKNLLIKNNIKRQKRKLRIRKHIHGTNSRPRMCVVKTNKHIQVQLIDDDAGRTIGAITTNAKEFRNTEIGKRGKSAAKVLGEKIAHIAKEQNIKEVVFDRGPHKYHGILAELADAARAGGLQF